MKRVIVAAFMLLAMNNEAFAQANRWVMNVDKDPFNDSVLAFATKTSMDKPSWRGLEGIGLRCTDGNFEIIVITNDVLEDRSRTRLRFDKETPFSVTVSRSSNHTAMFIKSRHDDIVRKLREGKMLAIEIHPWREQARAIKISLTGMIKHLNVLGKYCPQANP